MLEIRLFGTPAILHNGQPLEVSRKMTRAMLYFLAANVQPVGRARLATFFWPDLSDGKSRERLRDNLAKLRSSLPEPTLLQTTPQTVSLDHSRISVDYLKFKELQKQVGNFTWMVTPSATVPLAAYNAMAAIAELWSEPGFISGVNLFDSTEADNWLAMTRQRLENEYMTVIQHLFYHERATGNLQGAAQWLNKALKIDPFNEEVYLLLVNSLLANGQQVEARKQFANYQKTMGQDFGSQLTEEFEALKEKFSAELEEILPHEEHPWPVRSDFNVPYVGQGKILSRVEAMYKKGGAVMVFGETGAGKTRLAQEVHNRANPHPKLILTSCQPDKFDVPFYPWIELLRTHVTREEWLRFPPRWVSTLSIILPELATLRQDLEPVSGEITAYSRQELFDVLYDVLKFLSQGIPVMLLLEDVHWADETSCEFLPYLLDHTLFRNPNRLLLMTSRIEEQNERINKFLHPMPGRVLERAYLEQLTESDVADLAMYFFDRTPSQEFVEKVTTNSGGNPFFILETFQAILDSPEEFSIQDATNLPVSSNVYQLIQYRLERLSPDAHEILLIAAILGSHFDVETLEKAVGIMPDRFVSAVEDLEDARLIVQVQESKKLRYAFVHENIRECLLRDLPALRSKRLHYKIARALEDTARGQTDEIAITLAQHYEKAEEFTLAFIYWIQGADHAFWLTSVNEALRAFDRARELIRVARNLTDEQLYELYTKWADAVTYLDNPDEVEKLGQELLEFGQERKSDLLIGTALDRLSDACFELNEFERGLEYVIEAAPYVQRAGNLYEIILVQAHRGVFLYMLGKFQEARKLLYDALERIPPEHDERFGKLFSNLHYQVGIVEVLMGYPTKGLEMLKHALEHRHKTPVPVEVMSIYAAMGLAYFLKGEFKAGWAVCTTAIELGEQMEYRRMLGYAYGYGALNSLYLGLMDETWVLASHALDIGKTYRHPEISSLAYRSMGGIYLRLEDYQTAIEYFQKGIQVAGKHFVALENMSLLGYALAITGQVEEGLRTLENAYQLSFQSRLDSISVYAQSLQLYIQFKQGNRNSKLLEDVELVLVNAKLRAINRAIVILSSPTISISQRATDNFRQLNNSLHDATRMSDPLAEIYILLSIIEFKKKQDIPWQVEADRLNNIFIELAPRAKEMPFENAWQKFYQSKKEFLNI